MRLPKYIIALLIILAISNESYSYYSRFLEVRENSIEFRFLNNPASFPFVNASLIVSGADDSTLPIYLDKLKIIQNELTEYLTGQISQRQKAQYIFDFLHKNYLKKYRLDATTLASLLDTGNFNCLTSSLLYYICLNQNNIKAEIIALPTHVFISVIIDGEKIDVETVMPTGFDKIRDSNNSGNFSERADLTYYHDSGTRMTLTERQMLIAIYANRITLAEQSSNRELAYQIALKALALSSFENGIENLAPNIIFGITSYSKQLIEWGEYQKARSILGEYNEILSSSQEMINAYETALIYEMNGLVDEGQYRMAIELIRKGESETGLKFPDVEESMYCRIIEKLVAASGDYQTALVYAQEAVKKFPGSSKVQEIVARGFGVLVEKLMCQTETFSQDEALIDGWYRLRRANELDTLFEKYYSSIAASLFENGQWDESIEILNRALIINPNLKSLKQGIVKTVEKIVKYYVERSDYSDAVRYYELGLKYVPDDESLRLHLLLIYYKWANLHYQNSRFDEALEVINRGLEYYPADDYLLRLKKKIENR